MASILVVDDEPAMRLLVRTTLERQYQVRVAEGGRHALRLVEQERPDLIVTDLAMPMMDGYAFVRDLRNRPKTAELKIIALTAFPSGTASTDASGFDAFLSKPIDPFDLVDEVARVIAPGAKTA